VTPGSTPPDESFTTPDKPLCAACPKAVTGRTTSDTDAATHTKKLRAVI